MRCTSTPTRRPPSPAARYACSTPPRPASLEPSRPRTLLRRAALAAAALVIVAAVSGVLVLGWGPGQRMAGSPGPAAGALVDSPELEGDAADPAGHRGPGVGDGRASRRSPRGTRARRRVYRTAAGAQLEIVVKSARAEPLVPALGDAPAGYRWLVVQVAGRTRRARTGRATFSRSVSVLDDRGLWIRPLGDGVVECSVDRVEAAGDRAARAEVRRVRGAAGARSARR